MRIYSNKLVGDFIEKRTIISDIYNEFKEIIEYYEKSNGYTYSGKSLIFNYIKGYFYPYLSDKIILGQEDLKKWIEDIESCSQNDYIVELLSVDNQNIKKTYEVFNKYIDSGFDDYDELAIIKDAQFLGYLKLFNRVKLKFLDFLKNEVNKNNFYEYCSKKSIKK